MIICASCESRADRAAVIAELRGAVAGTTAVETVECMNVCSKPVTVAFRAEGKEAYLFAGVELERQAGELAIFARLYADAQGGIIEDARPCGDLRFCLIGRIPG